MERKVFCPHLGLFAMLQEIITISDAFSSLQNGEIHLQIEADGGKYLRNPIGFTLLEYKVYQENYSDFLVVFEQPQGMGRVLKCFKKSSPSVMHSAASEMRRFIFKLKLTEVSTQEIRWFLHF